MAEIIDLVERYRTQRIIAAFDRAMGQQHTWRITDLLSLIASAVPGATDEQIAHVLKVTNRCDIPADWIGGAA